jgi:L-iditol 2-dehydrogenase
MSYEAASFIEPLACVLRAQQIARLGPGQTVLVLGSGLAGLLHIQLARSLGAGRIVATDRSSFRLAAARQLGADVVFPADHYAPALLQEVNGGFLADLVLVCTGARQAQLQALGSVERGGTVLFFAPTDQGVTIPLSINDLFFRNDITLTTSYAGSPADHWRAGQLLRAGILDLDRLITHRLPLAQTQEGFRLVVEAEASLKVIIEPQK